MTPPRRAGHLPDASMGEGDSPWPSPSSRSPTSRPTTGRSWRSAASRSTCPKGGIVTILGANGAGKTTVLKTDMRRHGSAEGQRRVRGPRDPAHGSRQGDAARHQPRARGPRGLPLPERAREPAHGRLHAPRCRRRRAGPRGGVRLFPGAARARRPARRLAVGRRAADAGDQPRADGAAQADAARRAVARPLAQAGEGHLRHRRAHQPRARRHHPAGRAERQHGAADRRLRLRAGGRPHRHGRHLRAADGEGRHQGILPRHQGTGRPRHSGAGRSARPGDSGRQRG